MKKLIMTLIMMAMFVATFVQGEEGHSHSHGHAKIKASHGGRILDVGKAAHLEYVHDAKTGKITIYVLDGEGTKALGLADAIRINVSTGKVQVVMSALNLKDGKSSTFEAQNDVLKNEHLEGKLSIKIDDKKYSVAIPHDHAHGGHSH